MDETCFGKNAIKNLLNESDYSSYLYVESLKHLFKYYETKNPTELHAAIGLLTELETNLGLAPSKKEDSKGITTTGIPLPNVNPSLTRSSSATPSTWTEFH